MVNKLKFYWVLFLLLILLCCAMVYASQAFNPCAWVDSCEPTGAPDPCYNGEIPPETCSGGTPLLCASQNTCVPEFSGLAGIAAIIGAIAIPSLIYVYKKKRA
jgi:hypothetical protein